MTEEYNGDYYFPDLSKISTATISLEEKRMRKLAEKHRDEAERIESDADTMLYEQNYRKHIKTLKPIWEKMKELRETINNPATKKTALKKANREHDRCEKAFWSLMKYGQHADPKE